MYIYKIGICDKDPAFHEILERMLMDYQIKYSVQLVVRSFYCKEELLKSLKEEAESCQIVMMETSLFGGMSGIETAREIKEMDLDTGIIFVTNDKSYALDAFRVGAIDYLIKPLEKSGLENAMAKSIIYTDYIVNCKKAMDHYIQITMDYDKINIKVNEILYIEKRRNQSIIHTEAEKYSCYETLTQLYERLDKDKFIYVHQGFIVQLSKVKMAGKDYVDFSGNIRIPVSKKHRKIVRERFRTQFQHLRK